MKNHLRKTISVLMCIIMTAVIIPAGTFTASAYGVSGYCATAAAQWGKEHVGDYDSILLGKGYWNDGGDCANFVSQCLYMGGIDMSDYWNISGYKCHWSEPHGNTYAGSFIRCKQLYNFLKLKGAEEILNPSASQVDVGDVILFYREGNLGHSCIVIDKVNGVPVVAAHSIVGLTYTSADPGYYNDWHLGFSGNNTLLIKMYGSKCVNSNPRSFDVYTAGSNAVMYAEASASSYRKTTFLSGEYAHVYSTKSAGGYNWGYTFRYGVWGWVQLSKMNYKRHITSAPVDHIWGSWNVVKVANCKQDGLDERYCQRCGLRETRTTKGGHITDPHAWCTSDGFCKICGAKTENALGHIWNEGTITTAPTCTKSGIKTFTCERDRSHKYTVELPPLGHDMNATVSMPNCTANGTSTNKCTRCDYNETTRTGAEWSDWTTEQKTIADPPAGYNYVQSKTQYSHRDREYKNSQTNPLSGWELYDTTWVWSNYGNWSQWQNEAVSGSDSRQVETRWIEPVIIKKYKYWRYVNSNHTYMGTQGYNGCNTYEEVYLDNPLSLSGNYATGPGGTEALYGPASCEHGAYMQNWWFTGGTVEQKVSDGYTQYRYRDRSKIYTYHYRRWTAWSDYSDTYDTSKTDHEVRTRIVYRYNLAALGHNFTIDAGKVFVRQNKLISENESTGTCYTVGKICSRCGAASPDAAKYPHKFPSWTTQRNQYECIDEVNRVYRAFCKNGCGCYIIKTEQAHSHSWTKVRTVAPTCNGPSGERGYTLYRCSCGQEMQADFTDALKDDYTESMWEVTKEATCTESGIRIRKCLRYDACGHYEQEEIPALGHTMTKFDEKAMTCEKDGNTEYYYCSACEKYFSDEEGDNEIRENSWIIPASGHTAGQWIVEHENGCGVTGRECRYCTNAWCDEITACDKHGSHGFLIEEREIPEITPDYYVVRTENAEYDESAGEWFATSCCTDGIIYETCRNCEGTAHAHSWLPGVVEAPIIIDALEHDWSDYVVKEPSCVHPGSKHMVCQSCTTENCERCYYDPEYIEPSVTAHNYEIVDIIDSPCSAGTPMKLYVCTICGKTECDECEDKGMPHYYWEGNPADHDMEIDYGHSYPATCTENGLVHYICQNCEYCYDDVIPALGHKMKLKETVEPTCTEEGFDVYQCERCEFAEKDNLTQPLGHLDTSRFVVTAKGTCVSDGLEEKLCERVCRGEVCGAKLDESIIPARNHNMGEWYDTWDADDSNPQCRKRDCLNTDETDKYEACTYTETENHIWSDWVYDGPEEKKHTKTCQIDNNETVTVSCTFTSEVTKKATCTEDGLRTYTCSVCGGQYTEVIPAREHEWNDTDWHITLEPTIDTEGLEQRECRHAEATEEYEACAEYQTRAVDVLGANYRITIHEMGTDGEYNLIFDETLYDYIGKEITADYAVNTGMYLNENISKTSGIITKDGKLLLEVYIDRKIHNISFDDGTNKTDKNLYYEDVIIIPPDPEKEGYTFMGWSEDGETVVSVEDKVPDRDIAYIAVWDIQKHSITYRYGQVKNDAVYTVLNQDFDTPVTAPDNPEFTGYTFTGWDTETPETMPARDITITALWSVNEYKINYIVDEKPYDEKHYIFDAEITKLDTPVKQGFVFSGWDKEEPDRMPAENLEIKGTFSPATDTKYSVETYVMNLDGQYGLRDTKVMQGTTGELVSFKSEEMNGFRLNEELSETSGRILPDGSLVLKVYLDRNIYTVTYVVGDVETQFTYYFGKEIEKPEDPSIKGKRFTGWDKDIPDIMPAEDLIFHAGFVAITHTATFVVPDDEGDYTDETGTYKVVDTVVFEEGVSSVKEPVIPEKEGYYGYWEDYDVIDADIIIKAVYELIDTGNTGDIEINKTTEEKENGVIAINLDAFSETQNIKISTQNEPLDIVLVVDQSTSMEYYIDKDLTAPEGKQRRDYLIETATDFAESVKENAEETGVNHRISVVGFARGNTTEYGKPYLNSAVLTTVDNTPVQFNYANANVYRNSLMSVTEDYDHISAAIKNIKAQGGTAADLGFIMASEVFTSNESDRKKIVVFITDGEPTNGSTFDNVIANNAVKYAKELKQNGVLVYSVAIYAKADPNDNRNRNINKFLHAVSSNYQTARSIDKLGDGNKNGGYFVKATDPDALSGIFDNILVRSIYKTVNFNSVTLYDTLTAEFSMTVPQEEAFRQALKEEYGISNTDITVDRRDDGTTYIEIRNLSPKKRYDETNMMIGWGVSVSFDITANENAVNAGTYMTNTEDAGVEINNINAGTFTPASATFSTDRYIVEYYLDGQIYDIREYSPGDTITQPDVDFAEWDISPDTVVTGRVAKYEASLGNADKSVVWHIDGRDISESYAYGQRIAPPAVDIAGKDFAGWAPDIEPYMGRFDMEYTALFTNHVHSYVDTVVGLCTEGKTVTHTCSCGITYTEKLAPCDHILETTVYYTEDKALTHFRCINCNYNYEKVLTFKSQSVLEGDLYDLNLFEDVEGAEIHEDGEAKYLYVSIPLSSVNKECADKLIAGDKIYVYHISDDGTQELCDYDFDGEFLTVHCKSFSYYLFSPMLMGNSMTAQDAFCVINGHEFEQKSDMYNHWEECSVCGKIKDKNPHIDENLDVECDVCSRSLKDSAEIRIPAQTIQLYFKETADLCAKTNRGRLVYSSSNEKVATVDENGVITATGRGTCTVTATIEGTDISESRHVRVDYSWWQWVHWLLAGCVWYFKTVRLVFPF